MIYWAFWLAMFLLADISPLFAETPSVIITAPANNSVLRYQESVVFLANATDLEDGPLTGNAVVWSSDVDGFLGYGTSFVKNSLSVGEHVITATATDTDGGEQSASVTIKVQNNPPRVIVTSPIDNSTHTYSKPITFVATVSDTEESILTGDSVVWESDKDGFLGFGTSFNRDSLSVGDHEITVTATDSLGETGSDTISITVSNAAPSVVITAPTHNSGEVYGATVIFFANATDSEDGVLTSQSVMWESDKDGFLGYGNNLTKSTLSEGIHIITVTATDSTGLTGTDSITFTIGNQSPVVRIRLPANNSSAAFGESVTFLVDVEDREDLTLSGDAVVWTSDRDGFFGYDTSVTNGFLSVGTHTITATATDSAGLEGKASITITIGDSPPDSVEITSPLEGDLFELNEYIEFQGSARDNVDGRLSGTSLVWTSDQETAPLGTGDTLRINTLSYGKHLITLTATDSAGLSNSAAILITIEGGGAMGNAIISTPADGDHFNVGDYIEFNGSARDLEGELIIGESLVWTSNLTHQTLGVGESVGLNTLAVGTHVITLAATDSEDNVYKDFIVITVDNNLPEPVITGPSYGVTVRDDQAVTFSGYATDAEDGPLQGSALSWTSNVDGFIGSGGTASAVLSPGYHTISFTARDSHGGEAVVTLGLSVEATGISAPMTLESSHVSLPLGQVGTYAISGGRSPYRFEKNYPHIAEMTIEGDTIRVVANEMGETSFQIVDRDNTALTLYLTVMDTVESIPFADAGPDQSVHEGTTIFLDGSASLPGSSGIASWQWEVIEEENAEYQVIIADETAMETTCVAPSGGLVSDMTFRLTVTDNNNVVSTDDVIVSIVSHGIDNFPTEAVSFLSIGQGEPLGLTLAGGGDFVAITPQYPQFIEDDAGRPDNMIYGVVDLKIKVNEGEQADMILYFPTSLEEGYTVFKYSPIKGWYDYSDHLTFSFDRSRAYIILRDGDIGDDDGLVDGIISDPLAVGTAPASGLPSEPDDSHDSGETSGGDDSGGGCFISTLLF